MKELEADAQQILGQHARFFAKGQTCAVYTDGSRALRLALINDAHLLSQAHIQQALAVARAKVAPVLEAGYLPSGRAYCLEGLVRGDDSEPSRAGWAELGQTLAALHALSHTGHGLLQDRPDALCGASQTPESGLLTRLRRVWPFDAAPLESHPLLWRAPELGPPLWALADELKAVLHSQTAVCHTDLHHNQLIWRGGRLAALLDFGDATVAPPAWDSASLAFYHGWDAVMLAGLEAGRAAALFGLLLAFHRAGRAAETGSVARQAQAAAFARGCLERLA
ncbi:hypothetical protein Dxin01_00451 [Deinococcus xinjiangensis]|uniref:Aminoglycoside phosphotransferase domain-containing protein n=2 Tax=Deinococcus xinjiangensis TaxID=457454 RepID=A0ABP9V7Q1_9DEIO